MDSFYKEYRFFCTACFGWRNIVATSPEAAVSIEGNAQKCDVCGTLLEPRPPRKDS
jgi:hypothetical protein